MTSPYPTPKMKESLHQIKKELNLLATFDSESSSATILGTKKWSFVTPSPIPKQEKRPSSPTTDRTATNSSVPQLH